MDHDEVIADVGERMREATIAEFVEAGMPRKDAEALLDYAAECGKAMSEDRPLPPAPVVGECVGCDHDDPADPSGAMAVGIGQALHDGGVLDRMEPDKTYQLVVTMRCDEENLRIERMTVMIQDEDENRVDDELAALAPELAEAVLAFTDGPRVAEDSAARALWDVADKLRRIDPMTDESPEPVRLPRGVDPDEFRSRKAAGELRGLGRATVRNFMARVLLRQIDLGRYDRGH